ncbi:MAG: SGNH/GDSL hydrolase family protein [Opitutaceae bacterium]|nr:SGNH/GDSL hydrolase family protein [Opitutaceae bacterium]
MSRLAWILGYLLGSAAALSAQATAAAGPQLDWHDVTAWGVEGRPAYEGMERAHWFDRLPAAAEQTVRPRVWILSRDTAGMLVRFRTDATALHVDYKLLKPELEFSHMPATGVSGVDFYARDDQGKWRWIGGNYPERGRSRYEVIKGLGLGLREYIAYLPLYNGVESFSIGVPAGARFEGLPPRDAKPLVFYGTSITQGACASRPGMAHTAILGRRLEIPVVNLGFSGNGEMESAIGDYLVKIDAAAYIIDCLPNMKPPQVTERCIPLVRQLRARRPDTPIVLVEDRRYTNSWATPDKNHFHDENHAALRAAYEQLVREGVKNLHYIPGDHLYGDDSEGAVDASHATDLGFVRQADVMEPHLRAALGR